MVVYDPDHPEASLVWGDGEVMDIGMDNMDKTGNEVVEMNIKEDEGDELNDEVNMKQDK